MSLLKTFLVSLLENLYAVYIVDVECLLAYIEAKELL